MASRSRPARNAGPNLIPVFVTIAGLVVAAVAVAVMQTKANEKKEAAEKTAEEEDTYDPASNPFSDIDNSPNAFGSSAGLTNDAPAGLADGEPFVGAKKLAEEGLALVEKASEARKNGDEDAYRTNGIAAREKLTEAQLLTTDWLMELQETYPTDRQVRAIERETEKWARGMHKVRKIK